MHVSRQAHTPADPQLSDSASGMQSTPNAAVKTLDELLHRLVLAIAMPMAWAMAAALLGMIFLQEWQLKQDRERLALMARRSLDGQLSQRMRALDALAQSSAMAGPAIGPASYRAALDYRQTFNADVVVADPRGQMLINTRVPWGQPLPMVPTPQGRSAFQEAWKERRAAVGDLFMGPLAKTPMLALASVSLDAGVPIRSVITTLEAGSFARWLQDLSPSGSLAMAVLDSTGAIIASTESYNVVRPRFSPWIREHRVTLEQAPFQLVIQSNAWALRLPNISAWLTLLMGLAVAVTLGLVASNRLAIRLRDDLDALTPRRQGLTRSFACEEAKEVAQELTREHLERQALLDRLEDQERVQWDILHRLPTPTLVFREGRIIQANEEAERLFATSATKLIGREAAAFMAPDEQKRILPILMHARMTPGAAEHLTTRIIRGDGVVQIIDVSMVRVEHENGPLVLSVLRPVNVVKIPT
jgi:two-component system, sensor histidine kinase and response regulator